MIKTIIDVLVIGGMITLLVIMSSKYHQKKTKNLRDKEEEK